MCAEYVIDDQALFDAALARLEGKEPPSVRAGQSGAVGFINNVEQRFDHDGAVESMDVTMRVRFTDRNVMAIGRMLDAMATVEIMERKR